MAAAAIANDRRSKDRRFTDQEIEEILEYSRGYVNGAKKRQRIVGISMATLLGITTLLNYWIIDPLRSDIVSMGHEVREIEITMRKHYEDQAKDYVSKADEEQVINNIKELNRKIDRVTEYILSFHGVKR